MANKTEWLARLREEFEAWDRLLDDVDEGQAVRRNLPAELSIKDVVAHLWAWQQISIARIEAALEGRDPVYAGWPAGFNPDEEGALEGINARFHLENRDRPWAEVRGDWRAGFQRFIALTEQVPEADLSAEGKYGWIHGLPLYLVLEGSYRHHREEHRAPLVEFLGEG